MDINATVLKRPRLASQRGFTLTELMISVLIVGILAAIAVPTYSTHVTESRRTDAATMLMAIASQQEQYFLDNKTYSTDLTDLGFATATVYTENDYYLVSVQAATASCGIQTCYSIQAEPKNEQANDSCGTLTFNSLGTRLPDGCW